MRPPSLSTVATLAVLVSAGAALAEPVSGGKIPIVEGTAWTIGSAPLNAAVRVVVHVPPSYEKSEARYPVLVLLDFGDDARFAAPVADFLGERRRIPELIVVSIPLENVQGAPADMAAFLDKELIPFLDATYRTRPCRVLYGHSGRSFAALRIFLDRPDLFYGTIGASLGLMDPLPPGRFDFPRAFEAKLSGVASLKKAVFLTLGDEAPFAAGVERLTGVFRARAPKDLEWRFVRLSGNDHFSTKLQTLYQGLEFVFAGWQPPVEVAEKGAAAVHDHYARLSDRWGYDVGLPARAIDGAIMHWTGYGDRAPVAMRLLAGLVAQYRYPTTIEEGDLTYLGSFLAAQSRPADALAVYEYMATAYPNSPNAANGAGQAHEKLGHLDQALAAYERACALAAPSGHPRLPEFEANRVRLEKLRAGPSGR